MIPTWLAVAVSVSAILGMVLSYFMASRVARKESREKQVADATAHYSVISKLDDIADDVKKLDGRQNRIEQKLNEISETVAVHEDRFNRPALRAVDRK